MPSVTQVCCMHVDTSWIPRESGVRGTAVHKWANNFLTKVWDPFTEEEYPEYVYGLKTWLESNEAKLMAGEVELENKNLHITGHPDFIGRIKGEPGLGIIDFKTSQARQPWWKLQLAGYYLLATEKGGNLSPYPIEWCASLRVDKTGKSVFDLYSKETVQTEFKEKFINLLGLYRYTNNAVKPKISVDRFIKEYKTIVNTGIDRRKVLDNYIRYNAENSKSLFNKERSK